MLKVKISIEDNGKKAELELEEADNLSKLVIIQNVFNLFGINTDVLEMTKTYNNIGAAYSSFFNEVKPIETDEYKEQVEKYDIKSQLIEGLTTHKEELEVTYKTVTDQPSFVYTGIKEDKDGKKRYQLRYICNACFNRGTHFVYPESKKTWCHRCQHEFIVYPASPEGFPSQDTFKNFFRAGDYMDSNLDWSKK